ncbi:purine-binding chemotaxis protein CheW [Leptolyngbyaceae cyanobacterium CCMR0082]|uniref:Purine-binding chemotaxis protein CheW n=2 Tax=Adonisia turfae TaxID=2950184 RepID=A0A6M0SGE1_9CYAN|nr:chemotaxis protein CheW [Adonisia turfae]MDV3350001.1 chemotaxis protein CheW [Leptothoe sp. LEGE 181152]NEZ58085.1 purine-binding chemotaxis protein CheW [Adonisia turfae CCMR0081]NEZ67619.1 purine-binding chemotaxis protein CheW [Adonisia turfae CCMR0082]
MKSSVLAHRQIQSEATSGAACLSFQLNEQTPALFSMKQVQEVIVLPAKQITPMPNMPPCVLGLSTRRSRVMWLVDLAHMLLSTPLPSNTRSYNVVIIRVAQRAQQQNMLVSTAHNQALLGLIVPTMKGVIRFSLDLIQTPKGHFAPSIAPCLRGCLLQQDEMLLVLDAEAIARSPILQSAWG